MKIESLRLESWACLPIYLIVAGIVGLSGGCGPSRRDLEEQAASQSALAEKNFNDRKYSGALAATREAILLNTELRNDSAMADNYLLLASCQRQLGDYDSALVGFESTIEYFRSLNDQHLERRAKIALADFYVAIFRDADALAIASDAATSAKVFSNVGDTYRALMIVARATHRLGRYEDELAALAELARIDSQAYHGRDRVLLLRSMMEACAGSRDPGRYEEVFDRWKSFAASTGDTASLSRAYYYRGLFMQSLGRPDSALLALSRALGQASRHHDIPLQADILYALGNLAYAEQRFDDARRYFAQALDLAERISSLALKAMLRLAIVACESKSTDNTSGALAPDLLKRCVAAGDESRQHGFRSGEAFANFMSGRLSEAKNERAAALPYYRRAAEIHEESPAPPETRVLDFVETYLHGEGTDWYDPLIRLYCASGLPDSAFTAVERKNLLDLSDFFSRIQFKTADQKLNQKISAVQWNLNAVRLLQQDVLDELGAGDPLNSERLAMLNQTYPRRQAKVARSVAELAAMNSNFPWLLHPGRLQLAAIRDTMAPNTALVEFAPAGDSLYVFVIGRHGAVLRRAPLNRRSLLALTHDYNRLAGENRLSGNSTWITDPVAQSRLNSLAPVLGKLLLSAIAQDLGGVGKLYVALPPEFGWLPVHTLGSEDRPLGGRMNVSYVPTAAVLLFSSGSERPVKRVLGIGYPGRTSWDVEYELKDIRGFYDNSPMLFDTVATLSHLMDSTYDVIHVAAEFYLDRDVPDNSRLVLADGITPFGVRAASLGELLAVPQPEAIVLSNIAPRAGGLWRYAPLIFLANGTKTVIASTWQIDRKVKKYFGEGFYTGLLGGYSASEAYRQAIEKLLKQGEFSLMQRWGAYYQYGK